LTLFGRPFRPRLWPTLIALPTFLVLLGLGLWQLDRLAWKQTLIDEIQARITAPPMALPADLGDPALEFRRVDLVGHFLHERELYLPGKTYKGTYGQWVATPFVLGDGRTVIVNRGWVPEKYYKPESRAEGLLAGEVTVQGIVRLPGWQGWDSARPDNVPAANVWYYFDLPAMAQAAGLENPVTEVYVEALGDESTGLLPIGLDRRVELPNDHLQYAITWFALAVVLLAIYLAFHLRRPTA
jgi:surfeit locus 1 family protein